jgi:hypothetical protein
LRPRTDRKFLPAKARLSVGFFVSSLKFRQWQTALFDETVRTIQRLLVLGQPLQSSGFSGFASAMCSRSQTSTGACLFDVKDDDSVDVEFTTPALGHFAQSESWCNDGRRMR